MPSDPEGNIIYLQISRVYDSEFSCSGSEAGLVTTGAVNKVPCARPALCPLPITVLHPLCPHTVCFHRVQGHTGAQSRSSGGSFSLSQPLWPMGPWGGRAGWQEEGRERGRHSAQAPPE